MEDEDFNNRLSNHIESKDSQARRTSQAKLQFPTTLEEVVKDGVLQEVIPEGEEISVSDGELG